MNPEGGRGGGVVRQVWSLVLLAIVISVVAPLVRDLAVRLIPALLTVAALVTIVMFGLRSRSRW